MGKILYSDSDIEIVFDDRAMAHLQVVIGSKLRRGEGFFFSWKDDLSVGDGRSAIWIDKGIPLYFRYSGSRPISMNREWLELLTQSANSTQGLVFTPEPDGDTNRPKSQV